MNEIVKRLNPVRKVRRRLFALSSNRCAFPGCPHHVINTEGQLLAEICHIEAANVEGERFNPKQTNEERRAFENLILMCGTHHTETNDVNHYTVELMKEMKRAHEAKVFVSRAEASEELQHRFVDATANPSYCLPENFLQLDLQGWDDHSFVEANRLLDRIAQLPPLTRSLYAHALIYSVQGDLWLFVDPVELSHRLESPMLKLDQHFAVLSRCELVTEWLPEEAELAGRSFKGRHFYLRGLDREDYGIYFLCLMRKRFGAEPDLLIDIIENLNFPLLDA